MFARAQSLGWTKWTIPTKAKSGSNRSFLKEAVSRVYDNQLVRGENSPRFHTPTIPEYYPPRRSRSLTPIQRPRSHSAGASISKQRRREFAAELRRKRQQVKEQAVNKQSMLVPEERPISNFQEVIRRLNGSASASPLLPSSHDTIPTVTLTTTNNPPHSTVLTRGLSPTEVEEKISQGRHPSPSGRRQKRHSRSPPPGFVDPADKALQKLVHELGFREEDAKWALKCTDNGESLDVEAAINMLLRRAGKGNASGAKGIGQPPEFVNVEVRLREKNMTAVGETDLVHYPTWRWA